METRAARSRRGKWLFHGIASIALAPKRRGILASFYGSSYFVNPRGQIIARGIKK
jgi:hypothetical protein